MIPLILRDEVFTVYSPRHRKRLAPANERELRLAGDSHVDLQLLDPRVRSVRVLVLNALPADSKLKAALRGAWFT